MKWTAAIFVLLLLQMTPSSAQTKVQLNWNASTDNVGVTGYNIYRNGVNVGQSPTNSYTDTGLVPSTAYNYRITAFDAAGNESAQSTQISVTTLAFLAWPDATNTGIPAGTVLTPYTGPCTITTDNTVIDSKTVDCSATELKIAANNVVIKNSKIIGEVKNDEDAGFSFTITDVELDGQSAETGIGAENFTATRVHVYNSRRSMYCYHNATIQYSYVHGNYTDATGTAHESGMRMSSGCTFRHNTITCDAPDVPPDGGCSAGLSGYGDFEVVQNNIIDNNYFPNTNTGGYCAYGGSASSKPFPDANNVKFTNNVWQRKAGGAYMCGAFGPITGFDSLRPGNIWTNNKWDDGVDVPPAN